MIEYPKIQSLFKRDEKTRKFIMGQYSLPEFKYLKNNKWIFTEKIDGTNIRVDWEKDVLTGKPEEVRFGGRTTNAQMPTFLYDKLNELFQKEKFKEIYPEMPMTLFGEGYGAKIQKGGGNYIADGVNFILFDVLIDGWWLKREDVIDVANKLGILSVPLIWIGDIEEAIDLVKNGLISQFGDFQAEGLVLKPEIELKTRAGHRIITKLKCKDF